MFKWVLIYISVSALILALRHRGDWRDWFVRFTLVTGLPVVGWLLPIFWPRHWIDKSNNQESELEKLEGLSLTEGFDPGQVVATEVEKEVNLIPLEEALLINDHRTRRRAVIDLLKEDSMKYLDILQQAVSNDDTETSHYAVSAIVEIKRKLTIALQELSVKYEENKEDPVLLRTYADVLNKYLQSGFLDARTIQNQRYTYSIVLKKLIDISPDIDTTYAEKIDVDLELGEYREAEETGKLFLQRFPNSEMAYLSLMKVYFYMRSFDQLQETLEQLKKAPFRLSNYGLQMVRFWSRGA